MSKCHSIPCIAVVAHEESRQGAKQILRWQLLGQYPSKRQAKKAKDAYLAKHGAALFLVLKMREQGECALFDWLSAL